MRTLIILFSFFHLGHSAHSQTPFSDHIPHIQGIWIAEDFKKSFDETLSMTESKSSFDGNAIVGFRINSAEKLSESNQMNLGFGVLHSHIFFPEVSRYTIQNNDTLLEQGRIQMNIDQLDSAGYYLLSDFTYYSETPNCYLNINYGEDTTLTFTRLKNVDFPELTITYTRVSKDFKEAYPFPNPRDYFVREKMLTGSYILKDSLANVLAENFQINLNGMCEGFANWENKKMDFSTDVYCGPPEDHDLVLLYDPTKLRSTDINLYLYDRVDENTIRLWSFKMDNLKRKLDKMTYILEKKK